MPILAAAAVAFLAVPTIPEFLEKHAVESKSGLLTTHVEEPEGKLYLELPAPGDDGLVGEYLFVSGIRTGLGSNDVGLDRGKLGSSKVVQIKQASGKVIFYSPNLGYRAISRNPNEAKAVQESFAPAILWATKPVARDEDGASLIDLTAYLVRDAHGVIRTLAGSNQGAFSLDKERSLLLTDECLSFPNNLEFEAALTFASNSPGSFVRQTAADASAVVIHQHQSIVALPDDDYEPREFDPRMGFFSMSFADYATPLHKPLKRRWIMRHRLQKDEDADDNSVVEPIVYYLDPGVPQPVRSALLDGARWWAEAFEAAGFKDAYRVEMLPPGAHPLDTRYNVIQWVHRATRGWSYGSSIVDPRTGEIIKGHVSLGSLRVRQDRLIFEGLFGAEDTGKGLPNDPVALSLARIRQLGAHEVGHTLGMAHNFAASTYGRESVMDYPSPLIEIVNGKLDGSNVYDVGIGEWDKLAIKWAYSELTEGKEALELAAMVQESQDKGYVFLTDQDARSPGAAEPRATLWDNGSDSVESLRNTMAVRALALASFGPNRLPSDLPSSQLHEVFVPVYLHHRYQVEAAVKTIGGVLYSHSVEGDGRARPQAVAAPQQDKAIDALLDCLDPEFLAIPAHITPLLTPPAYGYGGGRERFSSKVSPAFDLLAPARAGAQLVLDGLLNTQRLARLDSQAAADALIPSVDGLLERITRKAFETRSEPAAQGAIRSELQHLLVNDLMRVTQNGSAAIGVRAKTRAALVNIAADRLNSTAEHQLIKEDIARFLSRPAGSAYALPSAPSLPPGSPIGCTHG